MEQNLQEMLALANAAQEESGIDMNEVQKGGGGKLIPAGYYLGRLVEYIEYGMQPQEYNGVAKDPAMEVSLGFALWGEGVQDENGKPYIVRPWSFAISRNEKARAFKLFKALNWKGTAKSFAQLLTQAFLVKIEQVPKDKTDASKGLKSQIDLAGFLPPIEQLSKQPYNVPDCPADLYKLFLWNKPTLAGWDSLKIEGTYDAKDGKPAQSKNRLQETILKALDFQGSALQLLMQGGGLALPTAAPAVAAVAAAPILVAPPVAAPVASSAPVAVATPPSVTAPAVSVAAVPALGVIGGSVAPAAVAPAAVAPVMPAIAAIPAVAPAAVVLPA